MVIRNADGVIDPAISFRLDEVPDDRGTEVRQLVAPACTADHIRPESGRRRPDADDAEQGGDIIDGERLGGRGAN